ncbi:MAG: hypothetical protein J0L99_02990 [Chitinophagales bacterium]|nr:hypothetical protein [Chitinophagales bacterium]
MLHRLLVFCLFILPALRLSAQQDSAYSVEKMQRAVSFAALTLGGDVFMKTGGTTTLPGDGTSRKFAPSAMPRFTIGGLHFWGHADFYVTFPLPLNIGGKTAGFSKIRSFEVVETGARVYPWAIRPGKLRPFAGISFQPLVYRQKIENQDYGKGEATYDRWITPLHAGLTYASKNYLFTLGAQYNRRTDFSYYATATQQTPVKINPWSFQFAILRYMDTDKGMGSTRSVRIHNYLEKKLLEKNKMSAWYYGYGPSTALQLSKSPYLKANAPYLYDESSTSFLAPDLSFGRYFSRIDANVGLSYRWFGNRQRAFDSDLRSHRHSLALEGYKFLFNYHGFAPFLGGFVSAERLSLKHNAERHIDYKPAAGLVFGWDIRVTRTQSGYLRTNLRWAPGLHLDVNGQQYKFDHLEFNFIQMVKYIGRNKFYKTL